MSRFSGIETFGDLIGAVQVLKKNLREIHRFGDCHKGNQQTA